METLGAFRYGQGVPHIQARRKLDHTSTRRIGRIRSMIARGAYPSAFMIDVALDRLLAELMPETGGMEAERGHPLATECCRRAGAL